MTKYSIKLILYTHQPNSHGLYPIYIRTTINRRTSYKSTGHFINKKIWDEKNEKVRSGNPNADVVNAHISLTKQEWERKLIQAQIDGNNPTPLQLKKSFATDEHNIFDYVDNFIISLKGKRAKLTFKNYRSHLATLERFNKSRYLKFEDIDVPFLRNYERWLRGNVSFRKDGDQKNYIHAIWKTLKTWFNAAKKEGIISHYPFDKYENPVYVAPDKDYLTVGELKLFEKFAHETTNPVLKECTVYFLFGCYSGMRISDWYQFDIDKHIKGDLLRLKPVKTKNKWVVMPVSEPLKRNIRLMRNIKLRLREPTINEKLKIIAKRLGINKHITSHTGRHTFAVTICLGNGLPSETAAGIMGITLDTFVNNYSQLTQEKIINETKAAWSGLA